MYTYVCICVCKESSIIVREREVFIELKGSTGTAYNRRYVCTCVYMYVHVCVCEFVCMDSYGCIRMCM